MKTIPDSFYEILTGIVVVVLIVTLAMIVDLCAGLYKAKLRNEIRSSWGLKRSLSKFISYIGAVLIAGGVDILMHLCQFLKLLHLDVVFGLPLFACLIGAFLLVVELMSLREKADEKTKTEISRTGTIVAATLNKDTLKTALTEILTEAMKPHKSNNNENSD